jgi:hypothetical protein
MKRTFIPVLKSIKNMGSTDIKDFIDHLNDESIDSLCECVFNVINTDLKLSKAKRMKLRNHIKKNCCLSNIKKITNRRTPLFKRRKALQMEGRGLPMLIASALPFLISLFTRKKHQ